MVAVFCIGVLGEVDVTFCVFVSEISGVIGHDIVSESTENELNCNVFFCFFFTIVNLSYSCLFHDLLKYTTGEYICLLNPITVQKC